MANKGVIAGIVVAVIAGGALLLTSQKTPSPVKKVCFGTWLELATHILNVHPDRRIPMESPGQTEFCCPYE